VTHDPRSTFATARVAHVSLQGSVVADQYVEGTLKRVAVPTTDMLAQPGAGELARQVLYGHPVQTLDPMPGFARDETTGYVGYVDPNDLSDWIEPTHRVTTRATFLFNEPDIKAKNPLLVSIGSVIAVADNNGKFARSYDGLYAMASHLEPLGFCEPDLARTAEKLIGTPYLWGGNSAFGIDCSGLVQMAVQAAGLACPGDSDQQSGMLGQLLPDGSTYRRNDLLFWKGHVGIVFDEDTLIHSSEHTMSVNTEPLRPALHRIAQSAGPVIAHRRLG
jgi:cell wall-associated NlpC family hydrolase